MKWLLIVIAVYTAYKCIKTIIERWNKKIGEEYVSWYPDRLWEGVPGSVHFLDGKIFFGRLPLVIGAYSNNSVYDIQHKKIGYVEYGNKQTFVGRAPIGKPLYYGRNVAKLYLTEYKGEKDKYIGELSPSYQTDECLRANDFSDDEEGFRCFPSELNGDKRKYYVRSAKDDLLGAAAACMLTNYYALNKRILFLIKSPF